MRMHDLHYKHKQTLAGYEMLVFWTITVEDARRYHLAKPADLALAAEWAIERARGRFVTTDKPKAIAGEADVKLTHKARSPLDATLFDETLARLGSALNSPNYVKKARGREWLAQAPLTVRILERRVQLLRRRVPHRVNAARSFGRIAQRQARRQAAQPPMPRLRPTLRHTCCSIRVSDSYATARPERARVSARRMQQNRVQPRQHAQAPSNRAKMDAATAEETLNQC